MLKWILITCIILAFMPMAKPTLAATATNISIVPSYDVGIYPEQILKDVTGAKKNPISSSALAALKRELAKDGWRVSGKMFYSGGRWLLRFSRLIVSVDQAVAGVLMPNMYFDQSTNCIRYKSNNQPVPGMPCSELN